MLKSMSIYQKDNKGMVKSNFVTLYLAFKSLIPTIINFLVGIEYNTQMIFF